MQFARLTLIGCLAIGTSLSAFAAPETRVVAMAKVDDVAVVAVVKPVFSGFPAKAQVGHRSVTLNGSGTRYKAMFQVYRAGLYLETPTQSFADIARSGEARRVHMVMLREVKAEELGKLFTRGIQENLDKAMAARLMPSMLRMSDVFNEYKRLEAGDQIMLDWVPGRGMVLTVKDRIVTEPFKEVEFYNALVGIWLGATPADWKLRDSLLGVKTVETAGS